MSANLIQEMEVYVKISSFNNYWSNESYSLNMLDTAFHIWKFTYVYYYN